MTTPYDSDYYLRGIETGKSNYTDYRWMPDLTLAMASNLTRHLGIRSGATVLDFGAARGFLVKAMRMLGVGAHGYDISEWAVENCDPESRPYMLREISGKYDWVICKDTLEHLTTVQLSETVERLLSMCERGMFVVVPLAAASGGDYVGPKDRMDITHVIRWTLEEWIGFLQSISLEFVVSGGYWIPGIKPEAYQHQQSCGFITLRRW